MSSTYPKIAGMTIHQLVETQISRSPDAIAVSFQGQNLSYQELNDRANKVSSYLQSLGVKPNSLVGLCVERSFDLIIGVLGILKAGSAYVPLDSSYPTERLRYMVDNAQLSAILTQSHLTKRLPESDAQLVCLDSDWDTIAQHPIQITEQTESDSLAYVIYTSGSTGNPKGVAMPHGPLVNLIKWQQKQFRNIAATTLQFTPISFDVSFQEIFSTLCFGGRIVLIEDTVRRNAESLLGYISDQKIERLYLPFIALQHLAEVAVTQSKLPIALTEVITAGEQLKITRSIAKWFTTMEQCTLCNQYGPSESHVVTSLTLTGNPKDWPHLPPIGQPIDNADIFILDPELRRKEDPIKLVEEGQVGELAIGGIPLAQGYLNQPNLTESRFILNPFKGKTSEKLYRTGDLVRKLPDGNFQFIERIDDQVKIRGVRIELGEIEAILSQDQGVKDVAVIAREDQTGAKRLHAYIVTSSDYSSADAETLEMQLRESMKQQVPSCMIPTTFTFLEEIPLTPSGKADRRSLPTPVNHRPALSTDYISPKTDIEKTLAHIWSKTLETSPIGIEDNFFDLGGNSLQAIQLVHQVRETFQIELPIVSLFDSPTVNQFAQSVKTAIELGEASTSDTISVPDLIAETQLDEAINIKQAKEPFKVEKNPQNVLVTGVTGFLGVFLLQELLDKTQANVHCLTRAKSLQEGQTKIKANLQKYGLWKVNYAPRIIPVLGDLAQPSLGLSGESWKNLATCIEVIYHSGASISLINPYSSMKDANVLGTQELLKLATQKRIKSFHFISTLDVFQTDQAFSTQPITEEDSLNPKEAIYFDGYTKSKWVSEQMVWAAKSRGLPVCVYRPAMISGHSKTGIANQTDLMNRLIKGFIQLKSAPQSSMVINIAPVDFFSQGVIHLSQQSESIGKSFNFINPNPVSMMEFTQAISDCGYPIQLVDHAKWQSTLLNKLGEFDGIVSVLTSKMSANQSSYIERSSVNAWQVSCKNVLEGLSETTIRCPEINAKFLAPYLAYFAQTGFIQKPVAINATFP